MKTLIELYDERPLENFLAADVFRPERIVYLCPSSIAQSKSEQKKITDYIAWRNLNTETIFMDTSLLHTDKVYRQLETVVSRYPDCAIDITGGSDAALFAAGQFCASSKLPSFTFSWKKQRFFNISNAEFAENIKPEFCYKVEDYFLMAGGKMQKGRVDSELLFKYYNKIDEFFKLFLKYRKQWGKIINWFQRASQPDKNGETKLHVSSSFSVKGERGNKITIDKEFLYQVERLGFIHDLQIQEEDRILFDFTDKQTRFWLRDVGSVLELYTWKACIDSGIFNDVLCSTIVYWENAEKNENVTNEIDVTASFGITPVFISCKTCPIDTDALNELAILKDHFGGNGARAFAVTTENSRPITKRRASALGIDIIGLDDLKKGTLSDQIKIHFQQNK
ncbi:MAG: DUF1887 family CARF protein [Eubacteriales bacterium]|nr:DUF1887 family CARF protein [Eubacteriales bacterium]